MKTFQFSAKRNNKIPLDVAAFKFKPVDEKDPEPFPIQGQNPGSLQEFRFGAALMRLRMPFTYQYAVGGGRAFRGGQVVDFLVWTKPLATPVYIQGTYWHRDAKSNDDALKQAAALRLFGGHINLPLIVWETQLPDIKSAVELIKKELPI